MKSTRFLFAFVSLVIVMLQSGFTYSQTRKIHGTVYDGMTLNPLQGIKVEIKGEDVSTISNAAGGYSLLVSDSLKYVEFAKFQGMQLKEIKYISSDEINIYLTEINISEMSLEDLMNIKITTAGKYGQMVRDISASVIVITRRDIEEYGYKTLENILSNIPGLYGIDDYSEWGMMFGVRGFWSGVPNSNLIIMVNGTPLTKNVTSGHPIENIPVNVEAIERIEVVRGPLSVAYGDGAFFGAINIITQESADAYVKNQISVNYGSFDTKKIALKIASTNQSFKYGVDFSWFSTSGIDQPVSEMTSDLSLLSAPGLSKNSRTGGKLERNCRFLNLITEYKNFYVGLVLTEVNKEFEFDILSINEGSLAISDDYNFTIGYKNKLSNKLTFDAKVMWCKDRTHYKYSYLIENFFGIQHIETSAYEITVDALYNLSQSVQLSGGILYKSITDASNYYDLPSFGIERLEHNLFYLNKDDNIDTRAVYLNANAILFPNFRLIAGMRISQALKYRLEKLHYEQNNSLLTEGFKDNEEIEFVPQIAGIYQIGENNTVKLLYGKAINNPSFFQNYLNIFSPLHVDLLPEYIETVELNFLSTLFSNYSLSLSLYNNQLTNLITRVFTFDENNLYTGSRLDNAGRMVTNGMELSVKAEPIDNLSLDMSFSYQNTKDLRKGYENIYPAYSPNFLAYIKTKYQIDEKCVIAFSGHYVDAMETYWDAQPKIQGSLIPVGRIGNKVDGYFILDVNFRIENLFDTGMYVNLNCSNLLDTEIRYPAFTNTLWADKGTLGYGRFFQVGIGLKF